MRSNSSPRLGEEATHLEPASSQHRPQETYRQDNYGTRIFYGIAGKIHLEFDLHAFDGLRGLVQRNSHEIIGLQFDADKKLQTTIGREKNLRFVTIFDVCKI